MKQLIKNTHLEWHEILTQAASLLDPDYIHYLKTSKDWLPGSQLVFAAFNQPLSSIRYILLGESPYPRPQSANGYAFWDNDVGSLWSEKGLSKSVNRATSLRNLMKMLLVAQGVLNKNQSQATIALIDKSNYISTGRQLFENFIHHGFLLLNASLVYSEGKVSLHARHWRPFVHCLFELLSRENPNLQLVLFGKIANQVPKTSLSIALQSEHPYNLSFVTNPNVIQFFKPLDLLNNHDHENNG